MAFSSIEIKGKKIPCIFNKNLGSNQDTITRELIEKALKISLKKATLAEKPVLTNISELNIRKINSGNIIAIHVYSRDYGNAYVCLEDSKGKFKTGNIIPLG